MSRRSAWLIYPQGIVYNNRIFSFNSGGGNVVNNIHTYNYILLNGKLAGSAGEQVRSVNLQPHIGTNISKGIVSSNCNINLNLGSGNVFNNVRLQTYAFVNETSTGVAGEQVRFTCLRVWPPLLTL